MGLGGSEVSPRISEIVKVAATILFSAAPTSIVQFKKVSSYTAQYPTLRNAQSALHFGKLVVKSNKEESSHAEINARRVFVHKYPSLPIQRCFRVPFRRKQSPQSSTLQKVLHLRSGPFARVIDQVT